MNPRTVQRTFAVLAIVVALGTTSFSANVNGVRPADAAAARSMSAISANTHYGKLPLSFVSNAGQTESSVHFQASGSGGTLSFETNGVALSLPTTLTSHLSLSADGEAGVIPLANSHLSLAGEGSGVRATASVTLNLNFQGANPNATLDGTDQLPGIANFFIGDDPSQWRTNVPTYAGVVYRDLYPGVDLEYAGHTGLLKGTYTLAAGVDPAIIRWQYAGADSVALDSATGDLTVSAPDGVALTEQAPIAWQTRNGAQIPITVGYQLGADSVAQFAVSAYDRTLPLTIDPGLSYLTYLGGNGTDTATGIAVDKDGNAYVVGYTTGGSFPTTTGVLQAKFGGGAHDVFVSKLNPTGTALVYSTYLGGKGDDFGYAIAVDAAGNAYITGNTSGSFPTTTGALQTKFGGANDAYVAELNPAGSALVYSTYLGGKGVDYSFGIAIDSHGDAYVTGETTGSFPTTSGAFQAKAGGGEDAFVSELNPAGSALLYSTYLGGSGFDSGYRIALDSSGNAYVTGYTAGKFPTTSGSFQTKYGGGSFAAFVSKLNPAASGAASLVYSTYLGGSGTDQGFGIAVDAGGNAYVTGITGSKDFPTTPNVYQTKFGGASDAFVTILNPAGSALVASTYLGGSGSDYGTGIAFDASGNVYVVGATTGSFPTTPDALQPTYGGGPEDGFIAVLGPRQSATSDSFPATLGKIRLNNGGGPADAVLNTRVQPPVSTADLYVLLYAMDAGGKGDDYVSGVVAQENKLYFVGESSLGGLKTTPGVLAPTMPGKENPWVLWLTFNPPTAVVKPPCPTILKSNQFGPFPLQSESGEIVLAIGKLSDLPLSIVSPIGGLTYAVTKGALPPGLALDPSTGDISGTPTTEGHFQFTVTVTDSQGCTDSGDYKIGTGPTITVTGPPFVQNDAFLGQPFTMAFTASGGQAPYTYSTWPPLPYGLKIDSNGIISGIPTTDSTVTFTVTATDAQGFTGTSSFYLISVIPPIK
ncbi:MAG: SBBP repeat-containing protein [Aggregatilineales bacterium]